MWQYEGREQSDSEILCNIQHHGLPFLKKTLVKDLLLAFISVITSLV